MTELINSHLSKALALFVMLLPSRLKIMVLSARGHDIHPSAYIGFSYMLVGHIVMEANTYIGHGNVLTGLRRLSMAKGSRINRWNRVASAFSYNGELQIGARSAISLRHYLDVCDRFVVGCDTIIAGHRSTFFTHSKGIETIDYTKPIEIGDWCYVGSNACFAPGAKIGQGVFVGMGAVVVGDLSQHNYCLLAGNPASKKKAYPPTAAYFQQGRLVHSHTKTDEDSY